MKKVFLNNESEIMNVLESGRIVEGRLALVKDFDGYWQIEFRAYRRKPQQRKNWLIRKLEHGWVKESVERIKVYESIPKELGTVRVMAVIDRETQYYQNVPYLVKGYWRHRTWGENGDRHENAFYITDLQTL